MNLKGKALEIKTFEIILSCTDQYTTRKANHPLIMDHIPNYGDIRKTYSLPI